MSDPSEPTPIKPEPMETDEPGPSAPTEPVFDRRNIATESLEFHGLTGVQAYSAFALEAGLYSQANFALDQQPTAASRTIFNFSEEIATGELTPFELLQNREDESNDSGVSNVGQPPVAKRPKLEPKATPADDPDSDYIPEDDEEEEGEWVEDEVVPEAKKGAKRGRNRGKTLLAKSNLSSKKLKDDGNDADYNERIREYMKDHPEEESPDDDSFHELTEDYKVSEVVWEKLYKYQKTGIRWMHQLHEHCVGGILADEMGLGKTVQVCVFLRSLAESYVKSEIFDYKGLGPTLIVCPATLMHQWVKELNKWFPLCRVMILHSSGSHSGRKSQLMEKMSIRRRNGSVLITSYETFAIELDLFNRVDWFYAILDEGHKIRNPNARTTLAVKELRTPHRLILSGSPMQNNLKELWSLIDFVYPGRLGSLKDFTERFAIPITHGGYANATAIQVRTAFKCAVILRDAINPYMLRRMKKDVEMAIQLPEKVEQVLFCDISPFQRQLYKEYLGSEECKKILTGTLDAFVGLTSLRKICNHPDLLTGGPNKYGWHDEKADPDKAFGAPCRSGKMVVVESLLSLWKQQGHKVLLFSQSKQMLTIMEKFIIAQGYQYLRMDGGTPIGSRQTLVNNFNSKPEIFVFLLTTRVGGLGINLTGANRVVIFDPDWNPSTDAQARERAWRIGQSRAVTIYRLLTSGTIEEKIYQRQIFKQFLANRVLVDPKQKRFFKTNDLHELFVLGDSRSDKEHGTETAAIFNGSTTEVNKQNFFDQRAREKKKAEKKAKKKAERAAKALAAEDDDDESDSAPSEADIKVSEEEKQRLMEEAAKKRAEDHLPKKLSKKARKEKKKKRKELLDGTYEVPFLTKQKEHKAPMEDPKPEEPTSSGSTHVKKEKTNKEQDDYVLGSLLRYTGVHSALRHDEIMSENTTADVQLIEDEAEAVAKRASDVLKQSRRIGLSNLSIFATSQNQIKANCLDSLMSVGSSL
uniref:DNA repair and recombination protein RAD54-like n=1 Tax=Panagrellus redivivus TaxID=6233 RepID=A0A7E4VM44_PANRE